MSHRMYQIGRNFSQRLENKTAKLHARMRECESNFSAGSIHDQIVKNEKVYVNCARALRNRSIASQSSLDIKAINEKRIGIQLRCRYCDYHIQELRLIDKRRRQI